MKRKNRTVKLSQMSLLPAFARRMTIRYEVDDLAEREQTNANIVALIEEIASKACDLATFNSSVINEFAAISGHFFIAEQSFTHVEELSSQPDPPAECQNEPQQGIHLFGKINDLSKSQQRKQVQGDSLRSGKSSKFKSRSCDISAVLDNKQKISEGGSGAAPPKDKLLPLIDFSRQSNDNSEQIQELMRRNKMLLIELQPSERLNTQISKTSKRSRTQRKEKKFYFQDDEGRAEEMRPSSKVRELKVACLGQVRPLPGQTLCLGLKKRTIMEHITVNKKRKRRRDIQLGDTCVLIEQIKQTEAQQNSLSTPRFSSLLKGGVRVTRKSSIMALGSDYKLPPVR